MPHDPEGPTHDGPREFDPEGPTIDAQPESTRAVLGHAAGETIGRFRLIEPLGEGGMGVVWRAEQTEPVRREVALKLIKPGMDSQGVLARFEAERQALAVMDHPCVARVFDGGATERGLPYFAMELVRGLPITEHCDRHKLSLDDRLELFIRVCDAVQHAHMKGVIHRDLKPSNILVEYEDGSSTPKVIDFGVAKALNTRLTEQTIFTEQGQLIGTPEYMSPEQAEMSAQDIDTRSDVYSLGVILYELLTGARPFETETLRKAGIAEIQRIIREVEPQKPSTKLSSLASSGDDPTAGTRIAEARRTELKSLTGTLRRDLDWVVMKCLEKDRARRYDTANALASEVRRYLNQEPLLAGPPSPTYRLAKFVSRNRSLVGVTGLIAGILVASSAVSISFAAAASAAQDRVEDSLRQSYANEARWWILTTIQIMGDDGGGGRVTDFAAETLDQAIDLIELSDSWDSANGAAVRVLQAQRILDEASRDGALEESLTTSDASRGLQLLELAEAPMNRVLTGEIDPPLYGIAIQSTYFVKMALSGHGQVWLAQIETIRADYQQALGRDAEAEASRLRARALRG